MIINDEKDILQPNSSFSGTRGIVTGAAGFIGSCMVQYLNENGLENLVLVDDFGAEEKRRNWEGKRFETIVERYNLFDWLERTNPAIDFVIHLGARTDTTEFDYAVHQELNVDYSQNIWKYCTDKKVPLIYASSAATYGSGETGYDDDEKQLDHLHPLNPYGVSKNEIDKWILQQKTHPPFWAGLKFFNVYGPNEYHKARMASVIFHAYNQIKKTGVVQLFKSHKPGFENGKQLRDFIYVKDVVKVIGWMLEECLQAEKFKSAATLSDSLENKVKTSVNDLSRPATASHLLPGIYNLGTGEARTFEDLVKATFNGLNTEPRIEYIDMPKDIRETYQYFTEANMHKLRDAGYPYEFYSLEKGVEDYVKHYLSIEKIY